MFRQVFNPDNLIWRFLARAVDFIGLSLCCVFCSLGIVTIIPALSALYYTIIKVFKHHDEQGFKTYFMTFKANLKQGVVVNLICLPFMAIFVIGYEIMRANFTTNLGAITFVAYYILLLIPAAIFLYLGPILARFDMSTKELFRNAFSLAIAHLPSSVILVLLSTELTVWTIESYTPCFVTPSLWAVVASFFLEKNFEKHLSLEERAAFRDVTVEELLEQDEEEARVKNKFSFKKKNKSEEKKEEK